MTEITSRLSTALADRYRIERRLGEGGMATVYLAEDLKHKRKVAVKVLRPELAAVLGAERFVQEITTTASLQHPNILPLFDSGEADGFLYYVMPYIEGETLREKLNRDTQLGIDDAVKITLDIADALDSAHQQGVIHRDIKPENILLHNGRPMVADFGIALAVSAAAGGRMTETGLSLGTPHYMSPEQATAEKDISARSDVYSLGSVLYEMLTGEPPHSGGSAQQIIMKIVTDTARPVAELRRSVPQNVTAAVAKALEKLPADRFESAAKFAEALTNPGFTIATMQAVAVGGPVANWRQRFAVPLAVLATVAILVGAWGWLRGPADEPGAVARFSLRFPDDATPRPQFGPSFAWAPDGSRFVYSGDGDQLYVRERGQLGATPLVGAIGNMPVFSPDGQAIVCVCGGDVKTFQIIGGPPLTLLDTTIAYPWTLDWEADGYVYFQSSAGLARLPEQGGAFEVALPPDTSAGAARRFWMDVLPNGRGALIAVGDGDQTTVQVADFATGAFTSLMGGVYARYVASGHVVVMQSDGTMLAAPFDQDAMEATGAFAPILEDVGIGGLNGAQLAVSGEGDLLYRKGSAAPQFEVVWVSREGVVENVDPAWVGDFSDPRLSPDGTRLALAINENAESHVWIKQLDRGPLLKLTFMGSNNGRPTWSPDGQFVTFMSDRGDNNDLFVRRADASVAAELLLDEEDNVWESVYTPDGDWLVYRRATGTQDVYAMPVGADSAPVPLLTSEFAEVTPTVSPDGRWLAYSSSESGRNEVYVRPFPNTSDGKWIVSTDGGTEPMWAHSGRELFYKSNGNLMAVEVLRGSTFVTGERQVLFSVRGFYSGFWRSQYDVAPDDQRFLMIRNRGGEDAGEVILVENFFEELRARTGR
jgi:serine/threonine-protein kinase